MGQRIVGIDEVGRGAWAGPVCVGAVIMNTADTSLTGLADSKVVSAPKRRILAGLIIRRAAAVGLGWASARFIDEHGIVAGLQCAAKQAYSQVATTMHDEIIIDGTSNFLQPVQATVLPKADSLIAAVSAASIVAKVARDAYMARLDDIFPGYGFASHAGYGTARHRQAIAESGALPLHRQSFAPFRADRPAPSSHSAIEATSGRRAEEAAARHLMRLGYTIVAANWRTRRCEVDIIARRADTIYFCEVKYRRSDRQGSGLEYVTAAKRRQMTFAARLWLVQNDPAATYQASLLAVSVTGDDFRVEQVVSDII